jgi:HK97 family phage portal protein
MLTWLHKAVAPLVAKAAMTLDNAHDWYYRNGYYRIAERGYSYPTSTGYLTEAQALQVSAVYGCVKIISEDVASLPFFTFRRIDDERTEKARTHSLYPRLHSVANPETTAMDFRQAVTANALLCGNGYARIERSSSDPSRIIALYQVMPWQMRMDRNRNRQLFYIYKDGNEPEETLTADRVFHLRGFSFDGVKGQEILKVARQTIGLALDQTNYAAAFFSRDHTPSIYLKYPQDLEPEQIAKAKKAWKANIQSHDVAVIGGGMDIGQLGKTNSESQLKEQREFQIAEVCRLFRMQPHKLADLSRATFSNVEQLSIEYLTNTLRPWLVRWEQMVKLTCLYDEPEYYVEHETKGMLRGDFATQTSGFAKMLEKGVYSINEVRAFENLNPIDGGDAHFIQLNMQSVVDAATSLVEEKPEPQQQAASPRLYRVKGISPN